ncbi:hypothetical protein [Campylobacter mucosalis]|uniref:hypothetical protein n=1 Tax=Campylobacter mucosalis TaxID=202 RepID=UPI00146FF874|nr:hypothetical protein [Campylobacter mucosalis]
MKSLDTQKEKFAKYLEAYGIKLDGSDEAVSHKLLSCAFELFCVLDASVKNHTAMRAKILNILNPKGE